MSTIDRIRARIERAHYPAMSAVKSSDVLVPVPAAEALCDLADAARELPPDGDLQTIEGRALRDRFADALARLDGDAEGEAS